MENGPKNIALTSPKRGPHTIVGTVGRLPRIPHTAAAGEPDRDRKTNRCEQTRDDHARRHAGKPGRGCRLRLSWPVGVSKKESLQADHSVRERIEPHHP